MVGLHPKMQLATVFKGFGQRLYGMACGMADGVSDVARRAHIALDVIVLRPFLFNFGHHVYTIVKNVFGGLGEDGVVAVLLAFFTLLVGHHTG